MVHERDTRLAKLKRYRDRNGNAEPVGSHKLYYKNESQYYPVYKVDLDYLIYNKHNGRLETDMVTWENEHQVGSDAYDSSMHKLIEGFLWESNKGRNKHTLDDLEEKGQQKPAIVTLDGVIIDGNRRAMLLRELERRRAEKQYLEAVILPDAYDENEEEIVRLETQYQLGEDSKLEYGPLEKYLHVKRLHHDLGIDLDEVAHLMGETRGVVDKYWSIMQLMDEYLEHIDAPGLYTLLKYDDGSTMEGMFVDLHQDIKRFSGSTTAVDWPFNNMDLLDLKIVHFDHIRYRGQLSNQGKDYRSISHNGSGRQSFFAHQDIWSKFVDEHRTNVDPVTESLESLEEYSTKHPEFSSRAEAARARDREWSEKVASHIKRNFGLSQENLDAKVGEIEPNRLLLRAKNAIDRIDLNEDSFLQDPANEELIRHINHKTYQMKRRFEKNTKD